jgi:8-amino-7-oxononanoate synthase
MAGIDEFLTQRRKLGLLRRLFPATRHQNGRIYFGSKKYIDFSSNDYLGLSQHPKLIGAAKKALDGFGTSTSASRLLSGDRELTHLLEEKIARFKNKESALVFNTGYQANVGIISTLFGRDDAIFSDRLNHASILDGIILSGAKLFRFKHNDSAHLKILLEAERSNFKKTLIVTESIFSMDGDRCPLKELVALKTKYRCQLMVDEAHATGIFGPNGQGLVEEQGLSAQVDLVMGTFSKALGSFGAYLATSKQIKEYLINTCRSFIYSTALPAAIIAANIAALELVVKEPFRRKELLERAKYLRSLLKDKGFNIQSESQIVPVIIGESSKTLKLANLLKKKGYWIMPIRPPTVPEGQARLRLSLTFYHDKIILEKLADGISYNRI